MDSRRSQPDTGTEFVRQAEALIRSLAGVLHARIHTDGGGIDAIHVVAADDEVATRMAGNVRSALLAGLATPIVPGRIHVRTGTAPGDESRLDRRPRGDHLEAAAVESSGTRDRLRLIHGGTDIAETLGDDFTVTAPETAPASTEAEPAEPRRHAVDRPRLVAVDVRRPGDGRIVCRVSVAWDSQVHRAEAVAMDLPGAAAQAAAQAAVRALVSAGVEDLELTGLREVEIAGREFVLVALRRHHGPAVRHRSGSALMFGTPERSAAEAAVNAANELI